MTITISQSNSRRRSLRRHGVHILPAVAFLFAMQGCASHLSTTTQSALKPERAVIDYAYFDVNANRPTVVVIGSHFAQDAITNSSCQTWTGDKSGEWHDALSITRAEEDQYKFRTAHNSASGETVAVRVKGADGNYSLPTVIGDGTNYWERFLTFGSPHDCITKNVQVRWCQNPKPELGSTICSNTTHALACKTKDDYVVVGVHFATGSVSQVKISFDYSQIDTGHLGSIRACLKSHER